MVLKRCVGGLLFGGIDSIGSQKTHKVFERIISVETPTTWAGRERRTKYKEALRPPKFY